MVGFFAKVWEATEIDSKPTLTLMGFNDQPINLLLCGHAGQIFGKDRRLVIIFHLCRALWKVPELLLFVCIR